MAQNYEENHTIEFFYNKYGINSKPDGRFSLYTTKSGEDFADKSEDEKVKSYLKIAKEGLKLKKNSSNADRAEFLAENLIINGEAHAIRTTEALLDPQVARFVVAADQCKDNDRVLTSKLKGTDFMVSYCKISRRADLIASFSCFSRILPLATKLPCSRSSTISRNRYVSKRSFITLRKIGTIIMMLNALRQKWPFFMSSNVTTHFKTSNYEKCSKWRKGCQI